MSDSNKSLPTSTEEKDTLILSLQEKIVSLEFELFNIKRAIFGKKSEKFIPSSNPEQTKLWDKENPPVAIAESKETISYEKRKKGHGRNAVPKDIYTEIITIEPSEEEKRCSCGCEKEVIGQDETTELEYKPAAFFAKKYVRPKYVCKKCPESGITTAKLPARPIERGVAGVSLIAWIIVSKYLDALPLYRIESMFKRYGIHINRSSMVGWIEQVCKYLQNIVDAMHKEILGSFCIQGDETTMKVMDKNISKKTHLGYLFGYVGDGRIAVFDYRQGRGRIGPSQMLKDYKGKYLMTDAYAGYNEVVEEKKLSQLICWAHARRGIFEAKEQCLEYAEKILTLIGKLYDIERKAKVELMEPQKRFELRQKESKPILDEIENLINNPETVLLPQSPMGKAVTYVVNRWKELNIFTQDGSLPIDNNLVERLMRTIAIGRKNYLFCGSEEGAKRAAIIYSIITTCKLNDINPIEYLTDILARVADHSQLRIHELTPTAWKMSKNEK